MLALLLAASLPGCALLRANGDLVAEAIRARGGALARFTRVSELRVHFGLAGLWRWRIAYRLPDRLLLSILTDGDDQHYLSDGAVLRTYVGGLPVSREPVAGTGFESWVRWTALVSLDVLQDAERIRWSELDPAEVEAPAVRGLRAAWRSDPEAVYRLGFDRRSRLVRARGPIEIPGIGQGTLSADFSDYRRIGHWELPFAARYALEGRALLDERVLKMLPDDPALEAEHFRVAP